MIRIPGFLFKYIFVVLGCILIYQGCQRAVDNFTKPVAYENLTSENIKEGMIVEGDIYYNFGLYEEIYQTKNGKRTDGVQKFKYIVESSEGLITLQVKSSGEKKQVMDKQVEDTYAYLTGESSVEPEVYHFKGKVEVLDAKSVHNMDSYLKDSGYTGIVENHYYIAEEHFQSWKWLVIFGLISIGMGVVMIVNHFKEARQASATYSSNGADSNLASEDYMNNN